MFPRPVGRMACAVDPLTGTSTVFSVADGWQPPAPMDGCPASPIIRYAGDHQVGGPSAFILLPFDGEAWWSKTSIVLRVRIAPSPRPGARITARAMRLDGSRRHVAAGRQPTYPGVTATDLQPLPLAAAGALPDGWLLAGQRGGRRRRGGRQHRADHGSRRLRACRQAGLRQLPVVTACPARSKREPGFQPTSRWRRWRAASTSCSSVRIACSSSISA